MPQIVVTAIPLGDGRDGSVVLRERIAAADFESAHFRKQLVERLGWAVGDAAEAEQSQPRRGAAPTTDGRIAEGSDVNSR